MTTPDRSDSSDDADSAQSPDTGPSSQMRKADTRRISPLWGTRRKGEHVPAKADSATAAGSSTAENQNAVEADRSSSSSAGTGEAGAAGSSSAAPTEVDLREQPSVGQTVPIPGRLVRHLADRESRATHAVDSPDSVDGVAMAAGSGGSDERADLRQQDEDRGEVASESDDPHSADTDSADTDLTEPDVGEPGDLDTDSVDLAAADSTSVTHTNNTAQSKQAAQSKYSTQSSQTPQSSHEAPTRHEEELTAAAASGQSAAAADPQQVNPVASSHTAPVATAPLTKRLVDGLKTLIDPRVRDYNRPQGDSAQPDSAQSDAAQSDTAQAHSAQSAATSPTELSALNQIWAEITPHLSTHHELDPEPIGSGGQGNIYRIRAPHAGDDLALKILTQQHSPEQVAVLKVIQNADMPHVADVRAFGTLGERSWEVQEWCHGSNLSERMRLRQTSPTAEDLLGILDGLVDALESLHTRNVIHRDVKPGNVLCTDDVRESLRLVDFGVSALVLPDQERYVYDGATDPYMSPEMFSYITKPASDWWALGIILLECLTGRHPFADSASAGGYKSGIAIATWLNAHDVDVSEVQDPRWQLLVRGLLTREFTHRWGAEQVRAWRRGETPEVFLGRDTETISAPLELTFDAQTYNDPRDWVAAMASQWDTALTELQYQAASWVAAFRRANTGQPFVDILEMVAAGTMTPARALVELQGRARVPITIASVPVSSPREVDKMLNQLARDPSGREPATVAARSWMRTVADEGLLSAAAHHIPQGDPWRVAASRLSTQCGLIRDRLGRLPSAVTEHGPADINDLVVERAFHGLVNSAKSAGQRHEAIKVVDALPKDVDIPPGVHSLRAEINDRTSPAAGQAAAAALVIGAAAWSRKALAKSEEARKNAALARHQDRAAGRVTRRPLALRRSVGCAFVMCCVAGLAVLPSLAMGRVDVPGVLATLLIPAAAATLVVYCSALYLPHSGDALVRRSIFMAACLGLVRCAFDLANQRDVSLVWYALDISIAAVIAGTLAVFLGTISAQRWRHRAQQAPPKVFPGGGIGPAAPLYWLWPPAIVWFFFTGSQWFNWEFDSGWQLRRVIQSMAYSDRAAQIRLNLPEISTGGLAMVAATALMLWLAWDYLPRFHSMLPKLGSLLAIALCVLALCAHPLTTVACVVVLWMTSWVISSPPKPPEEIKPAQPAEVPAS